MGFWRWCWRGEGRRRGIGGAARVLVVLANSRRRREASIPSALTSSALAAGAAAGYDCIEMGNAGGKEYSRGMEDAYAHQHTSSGGNGGGNGGQSRSSVLVHVVCGPLTEHSRTSGDGQHETPASCRTSTATASAATHFTSRSLLHVRPITTTLDIIPSPANLPIFALQQAAADHSEATLRM